MQLPETLVRVAVRVRSFSDLGSARLSLTVVVHPLSKRGAVRIGQIKGLPANFPLRPVALSFPYFIPR